MKLRDPRVPQRQTGLAKVPNVRHLTEQFALSALRRGVQIEQFLGGADRSGTRGIRWVEIVPKHGHYHVHVIEAEDVGSEQFIDVVEFPPLDPDDEHEGRRQVALEDDPAAAMAIAAQLVHANRTRWVNCGMAEAEYLDYLRNGRRDL
jgi:hypothetical protein